MDWTVAAVCAVLAVIFCLTLFFTAVICNMIADERNKRRIKLWEAGITKERIPPK